MKRGELKKRIMNMLYLFPETRNCDMKLTTALWRYYHPKRLRFRQEDQRFYVALDDIFFLEREDHVKRVRATIQNVEGKYLPTDPDVRRKRRISEEEWRKAVNNGFNN